MSLSISRRQGLAGASALALQPLQWGTGCDVLSSATSDLSSVTHADPELLTRLPFGTLSHWLQPWRARTRTLSGLGLSRSLGAVIEDITQLNHPTTIKTLALNGIRLLRMEIGWGEVDFHTESRLLHEDRISALLTACHTWQVRPLILLNAHDNQPAPFQRSNLQLAGPVAAGDQTIRVIAALGVVPNRSGFTDPSDNVMAGVLVTQVDGMVLHLSRPFPKTLPTGAILELVTLRYQPFSAPGTTQNDATLAGWLRYMDVVADFAGAILTPSGGPDRGFDLEIWNELTFGSKFLSMGNYFGLKSPNAQAEEESVWTDLPARAAAHAAINPVRFAGVTLTNGFASTIPWVAAADQHPRISAISKHPYPPLRRFPKDQQTNLTALGPDAQPTAFVPSYTAYFPEYAATAIQTETILRDITDGPNDIYGVSHGRLARRVEGQPAPVDVWLTELGVDPRTVGVTDPAAAETLKTKFNLRAVFFFYGIGVTRTYLFNAVGPVDGFGLIDMAKPGTCTPTLQALARAVCFVSASEEGAPHPPYRTLLFSASPVKLDDRNIFTTDPEGPPPLRGADCLVLLPFQRGRGSIAIVYYIMTRDVRVDWPPERLSVKIEGAGPVDFVHAYDPVADRAVPCRSVQRSPYSLLIELEVTDTPRILVIDARSETYCSEPTHSHE